MSSEQQQEAGVASTIDFTLRRVNIGVALDPSYNKNTTIAFLAFLYGAAITHARFENHVLSQLIPLIIASLVVSVPIFLACGGIITKRGSSDQAKWILQCLVGDAMLELFATVKAHPLQSFLWLSFVGEVSRFVGSMFAIAIGATVIAIFNGYKACKQHKC